MSSVEISLLDLLEETDQITDWYMLGIYLKLPTDRLTGIERQFSVHGVRRCKAEMFDLWMKSNSASWELIALALDRCGEKVLANNIRTRHLSATARVKPPVIDVPKVSQTESQSYQSGDFTVKLQRNLDLVEKFRRIEKDFALLASNLQTSLEKEQVSLIILRRFLREFLEDDGGLSQAATIDEVFDVIRPHYCFLNIVILKDIIEEFVGDPMKQQLKRYESQLDEFTESAKLSLLKEVQSQCPPSIDLQRVVFKLAGFWPRVTIKHFQRFVNHIFGVRSSALTHIHVEDGCICVSWFVRKSVVPFLVTLAQQKMEFMKHTLVLGLNMGDVIILDNPEKEEEEDTETDADLHSALLRATTADCTDAVEFLLSLGADANCTSEDGDTPLIIACRNRSMSITGLLLNVHANVNLQNDKGWTALMELCTSKTPNEELVKLVVQSGADVNIQSVSNQTTLIVAAVQGHPTTIQYLLDEGAAVNAHNEDYYTPLMFACVFGYDEIVRLLLSRGADSNILVQQDEVHLTPLKFACFYQMSVCVELLLASGADPNLCGKDGVTPLMAACTINDHQMVPAILIMLLSAGANPSARADDGLTALMKAAADGYREGVEVLLNAEAEVNIQDTEGYTALHEAAGKGHLKITKLLLASGARASLLTKDGQAPLDLALDGGYDDVCQLLITTMKTDRLTNQDEEVDTINYSWFDI